MIEGNENMLELVRADRPGDVIHHVFGFTFDPESGTYNVDVDMESKMVVNRKAYTVEHVRCTIQYPQQES